MTSASANPRLMPSRSTTAGEQKADRVRHLEREDDVAVVDLGPAELRLQRRLQDADHLAIDVVDRRGEEEQAADRPAEISDAPGAGAGAADLHGSCGQAMWCQLRHRG